MNGVTVLKHKQCLVETANSNKNRNKKNTRERTVITARGLMTYSFENAITSFVLVS
jgi:hypothetical protein